MSFSHNFHRFLNRKYSTINQISPILTNRNPRNLEKLRIGYKPDGYHLESKPRGFWHKLKLTTTGKNLTATIVHYENGDVIKASTNEWAFRKQLYSPSDHSAYVNLARVLAQRCLESGITEFRCDISSDEGKKTKVEAFLKTLEENGLSLSEPEQFKADRPWDLSRKEKPWEIIVE